jgi:ADP-heptose:LPS heptosyltransferase
MAGFPTPPLEAEGITGIPLSGTSRIRRVLFIRLHAFGDTVITLPALAALRTRLPETRLEVVTDVRSASIFEARLEPERVWSIDTRIPPSPRVAAYARLAWELRRGPPIDAVIDLQRSRWSRALTAMLRPPAWCGFDRFAPRSALTRYLEAIAWLGLGRLEPRYAPALRPGLEARVDRLLRDAGWDGARPLVGLNPAGSWATKHWPIERYITLGQRLEDEMCVPVLLGAGALLPRLARLSAGLGPACIDLSGRTSPAEAMAVTARLSLMVSDDSGLMHMAWTQGVPTVAMFGSSRWVWSRPEGPHTTGFSSEDLKCGACMQPTCARGDLLCLSRVGVDEVLEAGRRMMGRGGGARRPAAAPASGT